MTMNNDYCDTLKEVLNNLRNERDRRINAYNSGYFCDDRTLERNINIIQKTIIFMNKETLLNSIKRSRDK